MSTPTATVLFDAPGPRARRRNTFIAIVFGLLIITVGGFALAELANQGQLSKEKWQPFTEFDTWNTYILPGLLGTLKAAAVGIICALVMGVVLGIGKLSDHRSVRWLAAFLIQVFRSIPLLILMIFTYYLFLEFAVFPSQQRAFAAVVVSLTLYNGAVIAEILAAGVDSLPTGQTEAAQSLGLRKSQTLRIVLLPQAISAMLPALISQMVIALKDSALGYQIGYIEVVRSGTQTASYYFNYLPALVVVALVMITLNFSLSGLATWVEKRLRTK